MLVLTRKVGEDVTIGEDITVKVVKINRNTVRLGIEAPQDKRILRTELNTHRESARNVAWNPPQRLSESA